MFRKAISRETLQYLLWIAFAILAVFGLIYLVKKVGLL